MRHANHETMESVSPSVIRYLSISFQGPEGDQEPESEVTVTELMKAAEERKKKLQRLEMGEEDEEEEGEERRKGKVKEGNEVTKGEEEDAGVNWGMSKYCFGLLYTQRVFTVLFITCNSESFELHFLLPLFFKF